MKINNNGTRTVTISAISIASLLAANSAFAAVQYSGSGFTWNSPGADKSWDINGDGTNDALFKQNSGGTFAFVSFLSNKLSFAKTMDGALNLNAGNNVSGALNFISASFDFFRAGKNLLSTRNRMAPNTDYYVGFKLAKESSTYYGWFMMKYTYTSGINGTITIEKWAYEDVSGTTIAAGNTGMVPEPSEAALGLGALALGAAGLRRWRKTKAAKAA